MSIPVLSNVARLSNGINTVVDLSIEIAEMATDGIKGGMSITKDHFSLIKERSDEYLEHQRSEMSRANRRNERNVATLEDARQVWKQFRKATKSKMLFSVYLEKYNPALYAEFKDVLEKEEQPKEKAAQNNEDNNAK